MYVEEVDSSITERELACILQTALGVADLQVTSLFQAVDTHGTGKITFGEDCCCTLTNSHLAQARVG